MQLIQFIETVQWIERQFPHEFIEFFSGGFMPRGFIGREDIGYYDILKLTPPDYLLSISHHLARKQPELESNSLAKTILKEFELECLIEISFPIKLARLSLDVEGKKSEEIEPRYHELISRWTVMTKCIGPIRNITKLAKILEEQDYDDILTVEVRPPNGTNPRVDTIAAILKLANDVYLDVAKLMGNKDSGNLVGVYASSGSDFRFDFKGLGEPIKEIKKLLVELWQRIRHRKSEDLDTKNAAIISSLKTLEILKQKRDKGVISDEDSDKLARKIFDASLKLFKKGGLIREIQPEEIVSNRKLIEAIQIKELPPATNIPETTQKIKKKQSKKGKKKTRSKTQDKNIKAPKKLQPSPEDSVSDNERKD